MRTGSTNADAAEKCITTAVDIDDILKFYLVEERKIKQNTETEQTFSQIKP